MKINNIKINGFGKLENNEINLSDGINLIYGNNEAGKTTLLKFISSMFYGVSKNKNKKEFSDLERYKPWKADEFSGKITYKLDNNEEFEVFRDFNKKNPKIYKNGEDISKSFNIDKTRGNEFFYEQTKIDEKMLYSTSLIEQKEVELDDNDQAVLTQKIANILSAGDENLSYKKTIAALNKRLLDEVGTERSVRKPLNLLNEEIKKIENERNNLDLNENRIEELENFNNNANKKIEEKEIKINLLKNIKHKIEENNLEDEKIKINNNLIEEEKNKKNELEKKLEKNKIKKEKNNLIYFIILGILIIINLLLFILKINILVNITLLVTTGIYGIFILIKLLKSNKKIKEKNKINNNYLLEIKNINNNIENIKNNINKLNEEKTEKNKLEENKIINLFKNKIDEEEINNLFRENKEEINKILLNLEDDISKIKMQAYTNEIDYNNINKLLEKKAKLEEELQYKLEKREEILKYGENINIAIKALESAYNKMKKEITPQFTRDLSEFVEKISNKKYVKAKYIDEEGLVVQLSDGEYINSNKLSIGTIDELYLSLRLSAMQEITDESMPIILDETFAYFDNERLENILKLLENLSNKHQIIIFTCSNREKNILENNRIEYNYINL